MRFWVRSLVIVGLIFGTFFLLPTGLIRLGVHGYAAIGITVVVTVLGGNWLLYVALRCPRCAKWACRLPSGHATVWTGLRCRHCDEAY